MVHFKETTTRHTRDGYVKPGERGYVYEPNDLQKETQLKQVESKKDEFITHVKKEIEEAQKKTSEEKKIHDACEGRFPIAAQSNTLEHEVENYKSELDAIEIKLQKVRKASL